MNRVMLAGRLGRDTEVKTSQSGSAVANLRIATRERRKEAGEWVDAAEWHSVVCFGKTAELAGRYLSKGRECIVEGKLQTRSWEGKDGVKRYRTEVLADRLEFIGGKGEQKPSSGSGFADSEIPF